MITLRTLKAGDFVICNHSIAVPWPTVAEGQVFYAIGSAYEVVGNEKSDLYIKHDKVDKLEHQLQVAYVLGPYGNENWFNPCLPPMKPLTSAPGIPPEMCSDITAGTMDASKQGLIIW